MLNLSAKTRGNGVIILLVLALVALAVVIVRGGGTGSDLKTPWIWVMLVLLALCAMAGWVVNGRFDGILIDDRYRISLSRFQWVMWLIIIIGGYFTIAVAGVSHGGSLPKLDNQLLILLGIVSASPVLSNVIVDKKKTDNSAPPAPVKSGDTALQVGAVDANGSVDDASWYDLFMGEDAANRYVVDVSRLQNLVFTLILGIAYLTWLSGFFVGTDTPREMPPIPANSNFNWLLGISHLAYQGYKATPKTPSPTTSP
jgi:hypothetical protein